MISQVAFWIQTLCFIHLAHCFFAERQVKLIYSFSLYPVQTKADNVWWDVRLSWFLWAWPKPKDCDWCNEKYQCKEIAIVVLLGLIFGGLQTISYFRLTYPRRASLLLMKRKWAGSQMKPADWHASTQDWPSWDTSSLRELRGGQTWGTVILDGQPRAVELGRGTNRGPVILLPPADPFLERLAGMKGGSGAQKSCRWKIW